jgi:hypothetical protein
MIGNKYKRQREDLLLRESVILALPAGGNSSVSYNVPMGRGEVQAIEFSTDNNTLADLVQAQFTLQGNKKNLISAENLVTYSPQYANRWSPFPCCVPEQATIDISGENLSGTAINVIFTFLYYNPFIFGVAPVEVQNN